MKHISTKRPSWKSALSRQSPLLMPVAHDGLTARLIELAGFDAYQIGGFAVAASMHAVPDIDLEHYGEKSLAARNIIGASPLPVMVDADDGYGDVKNVTRTVREYERMGASGLFIEDQKAPKKCGHMDDKHVIPVEEMEDKVRAAVAARTAKDFFILARTDALAPNGVDDAIRRAERYLKAGADGAYVEGPTSIKELEQIARALCGSPLATSILENGGKTPWVSPKDLGAMGYSMILYPTTLLFQITRTAQEALHTLMQGHPLESRHAVTMDEFEKIVDLPYWQRLETK